MVRNYTDEPVAANALDRIMVAAARAPSAGFSQGQRFIVVTDRSTRSAIAAACGEDDYVAQGFDPWISRAPVHVVVCTDKGAYLERYAEPDKARNGLDLSEEDGWEVPYWWVDAGASMMAILYAAVDEGLAAGFLGAHATADLESALGIPDHISVVGICTIGHPAEDRRSSSLARGWRPSAEVVMRDRWTST